MRTNFPQFAQHDVLHHGDLKQICDSVNALEWEQAIDIPDGVLTIFDLPHEYLPGSTEMQLQGLIMQPGVHYTEGPGPDQVTLPSPPMATDILRFRYRRA